MRFYYIILISMIFCQSWDNHSELNWKSFETEHFIFYFHDETERTALEAAKVAEIIYEPVTSLYQFYPEDKTAIILKDINDYSNGMAMFFDNKIEIWAKPMDFDLRGSHRWIQDVLTHEFVHIVQLGASIKFSDSMPGFYFQFINYEDEKRDDVLYGYPNQIVSIPLPGTSVPPWFAEGVAQYMYDQVYYDFWDSHRDMILRDAILSEQLYDYDQMSTFGKKGIGNEIVYNQGFAFVRYIVSQYGESILRDITNQLSKSSVYSMDKAFNNATNDNIREVFLDFKMYLLSKYSDYQNVYNNNQSFIEIEIEGTANMHSTWSKDGKKLLFLSDKKHDFFNKADMYIYDFGKQESEKLVSGVKGTPSWVNDSTIIYSKISMPDKNGSKFFDIYQYNINSEEEDRLTYGQRLYSPSYNKELNKIVAVNQYDGTSNIMIADYLLDNNLKFKALTDYSNGFQIIAADWLESEIIFDAVVSHGRDIYKISLNGDKQNIVKGSYFDERDPYYDKSSNLLVWSEDRSGIFNIYYNYLDGDDKIYQITNVSGGCFYPSTSSDGKIAFSVFRDGGYNLVILEDFKANSQNVLIDSPNNDWSQFINAAHMGTDNIIVDEKNYSEIPKYYDYNSDKLDMLIMPRLLIDYNTVKPGFYMLSTDDLGKLSVFSGASINNEKDLDLFIMFENYNYSITPYVNLFWVTRNKELSSFYIDQLGQEYDNIPIKNEYLFNLFSVDAGFRYSIISDLELAPGRHKFWINYQFNNYREKVEQTIRQYDQLEELDFYDNFDFSFDYYRSHIVYFEYKYSKQQKKYIRNMLPSNGYDIRFKLSYELNDFLNGFGIYEDSGTFGSILSPNNTLRFELDFNKNWLLNQNSYHNISLVSSTSLGFISKENIDDFFYFFGGGMPGLKGYTYYDSSLIGSRKMLQSFYIRTPIFKEQSIPFLSSYFKDSTFGIILQAGNVYTGDDFNIDNFKLSSGIELRLFGYNVYSYPLAVTYEYHVSENNREGKHYFKVLFDF